jgi:hypothetical protein
MPRVWHILSPRFLLSKVFMLAKDSKAEIQSLQARGKPKCCSSSSKNGHATELKAYTISTLRSNESFFLVCNLLAVH